mmetsp:Transcript_23291/g.35269  ORF Transcript_23291/g.35269 Transcript_23291/m.35269 type:complete len:560 (+) Transcript_23291:18-1697(+)
MKPTKKDKYASENINKAEYQRGRVQQARKNYLESQKNRKRRKEKDGIANAPAATPPRQKSLKNKSKKEKHALELAPPFHTSSGDVEEQSTNDENDRKPGAFDVRPGGLVSAAGQVSSQSFLSESERRNGKDKIRHENENENIVSIPNATLVVEEEDFETRVKKMFQRAPVAEVVYPDSGNEEKRRLCTRKMMIFIAGLLLVLLIVAIVVPYVVLTQPKNPTPTAQPLPTLAPFYPLITDYDSITLYLKLGDSSNIGFDLACGDFADDVIERRKAPAFFGKPRSVATDVYNQVPVGRDCEVKVTNMDGTGLQPGGFLRIYQGVGQISDDTLLLEMSGDFTNEKTEVFKVGISESNVPSLEPTIALSATPSTDVPTSTNAPTSSPISYGYGQRPKPTPLPTDSAMPWPTFDNPFPFPPSFFEPPPTANPIAPTQAPITPPPTFASLSVTVDILLDNFPIETGWNLTCGNDVKADFPAETYFAQNWNIVQSFSINYNEPCTFFIIDSAEDGVCCSNGQGRYRIDIVGDGSSTNLLSIDNNGDFGAASHEAFECTVEGCTIIK